MFNRRDFLKSASMSAVMALSSEANAQKSRTLFGTSVEPYQLRQDAGLRAATIKYAQIVSGENAQKMDNVWKSQDKFDPTEADYLAQFASENGLQCRGHTLVFQHSTPKWADALTSPLEVERVMVSYIERMVNRYKGKISTWDVVNEPLSDRPINAFDLRNSVFQRVLGEKHIDIAFRKTRAINSTAKLILNEWGTEYQGEKFNLKRDAFQKLVFRLLDRGVPLSGVGFQSHIGGHTPLDVDGFQKMLEPLKKAGLEVQITELDVVDQHYPADIGVRDAIVATKTYDYLKMIYDVAPPTQLLTWGLSDKYTWLYMQNKRKDGLRLRVLPLDENNQPKLMFNVIKHFQNLNN